MICGMTQYMCAVYVCVYTYTYVIAQGPENNIVIRTNHSLLYSLEKESSTEVGVRQTISKSIASAPPLPKALRF